MESLPFDISNCKGIIQQGPRKGLQCQRETTETGYCIYHQRNYEYDTLISSGKKLCNGFFRGCNNELTTDELNKELKYCSACRLKKSGKLFPCTFTGCTAKIKSEDDKYCENHVRQLLHDDEKENNIQYCDISRGCFNILTNDVKCTECREKEKQKVATELSALRNHYGVILQEKLEKDILFEKQENSTYSVKEVWRNVQRNAVLRKRLFTLSQEDFEKIVIQPCYYCGFYSNYKFNGIDRIDNNKGYILENCVSACKMCNMMKNTMHPNEFLDKVNLICSYRQDHISIKDKKQVKWIKYLSNSQPKTYIEYKNNSENIRNIQFHLTILQYDKLIKGECYLCGINPMEGHRNGIDRVDNSGNYTIENCKSCCGHCNKMKRESSYNDFISKCIQIKLYSCNRIIFQTIQEDETKLENEYYTAEDISKFLKEGKLTKFLEWCEEKGKTIEFTSAITYIASKLEGDIVNQIKKELENERTRKVNQMKHPEKKHLQCTTLYIWLISGKHEEFVNWYITLYEKTSLFDSRFEELVNTIHSMTKEDGIKACKKFLYDEKSRRNSQKNRDQKKENVVKYSPKIELSDERNKIPIIKNVVIPINTIVEKVVQRQIPEKKNALIPKQWKVADIYKIIHSDKEQEYYKYIKENNDTETIPDFEIQWNTLLLNVKNKEYNKCEENIKEFVCWLRTIRHTKLCAVINEKRVLEKDNRHHYRTDGILILFKTKNKDELQKFKSYTELYAGDNPEDSKWIKRWNEFIVAVENETLDENKKKLISNFLMAQRKKKNDRNL